ncbi:MAG: molybdopterin cofactor-binding domain-containing protein [Sporichthyaceae bacterium]
MSRPKPSHGTGTDVPPTDGPSRRTIVGWVLAAPTLVVAARMGVDVFNPETANAATTPSAGFGSLGPLGTAGSGSLGTPIPCSPQIYDSYDQSDILSDSCRPTNNLLTIEVDSSGRALFDMPRAEVGQGLTTAVAMIIAEELDLPLSKVKVTMAKARPELIYNQLTGGSNSVRSLYDPLRAASAAARGQLVAAAARSWGLDESMLTTVDGVVRAPDGRTLDYGALSPIAASPTPQEVPVKLKARENFSIIGKPTVRTDALAAIIGAKMYAMDLKVDNALPTMVCRPPTYNGTVNSVRNMAAVKKMPGITDVGVISTGVAVRGKTFGQCVDAVRALKVDWGPGTVDDMDNDSIGKEIDKGELPMQPALPGTESIEHVFTFNFRSGSPLETNCAVADVRDDRAEVWSSLKCPIVFQQQTAQKLGLPLEKVVVNVTEGGGSFGRHLFHDAPAEAVEASKLFGKPVRLMWHRTDDNRHGRMHAMSKVRIRMSEVDGAIAGWEVRHTAVATDFTHGFGEIASNMLGEAKPFGNLTLAQTLYTLETGMPYNFGLVNHLLNEVYDFDTFPTSAVRNVYSPDTATARELMVDQMAKKLDVDPVEFRLHFNRHDRMRDVIEKCAKEGNWGRKMARGTAQGFAIHEEYKAYVACLMEIDTRPATVNRKVRDAFTGPRITKVTMVVDTGMAINPRGVQAQMMGGAMDGIAQALTASNHIKDGLTLEGSWDDYRYTRQWNSPPEMNIIVLQTDNGPGGAGELGCGVSEAAAACAYARAVGKMPTEFPINFRKPLGFKPKSKTPPIPQSPVNGLRNAR